jgi:hypothetical protein
MSQEFTPLDSDLRVYVEALRQFPEVGFSEPNYLRARQFLVAERRIKPGQMQVDLAQYLYALASLRSELDKREEPKPEYRMGMLFDPDEDDVRKEPAPFPESPADPWAQQEKREQEERIGQIFEEVLGRKVSQKEGLHEIKLRMASQSQDPELKSETETVYATLQSGAQVVNKAATARVRAANKEHNDKVRAARGRQ